MPRHQLDGVAQPSSPSAVRVDLSYFIMSRVALRSLLVFLLLQVRRKASLVNQEPWEFNCTTAVVELGWALFRVALVPFRASSNLCASTGTRPWGRVFTRTVRAVATAVSFHFLSCSPPPLPLAGGSALRPWRGGAGDGTEL